MDVNKMIGMVVGVMVGVLVLSAALFPVIDSATTTERTFENHGYFNLTEYSGDNIVYSAFWDHTAPNQLTVNDEVIPIEYSGNAATSIVLDGNFFLRYRPATSNVALYYGNQAIVYGGGDDGADVTLTYSDGVLTVSNGTLTREISVETFYSISNGGDYVMKLGDENAYMNSDSLIYGAGRTNVGTDIVGTLVSGTAEEVEVTIWRGSATPRDITINKTAVSGYKDLYSFSSVEFVVDDTLEDNPTTEQTITYSYVVVPAKVTAELAVHASQDEIDLLNTIPILITIGLIMGIVGMIAVRRLE